MSRKKLGLQRHKTCKKRGCKRHARTLGLCATHYQQKRWSEMTPEQQEDVRRRQREYQIVYRLKNDYGRRRGKRVEWQRPERVDSIDRVGLIRLCPEKLAETINQVIDGSVRLV